MQNSYTKNYFKIYVWQGISFVLNFISMIIVIPFLTSNPVSYGVYSVCVSFSIFLAYADLGFIGAGQKYAAEYFAKGDKDSEIKVIGFTNFILGFFLLFFSIFFGLVGLSPQLLVRDLVNDSQQRVATSLFFILAIFTPTTLLQRLTQMICGIRMEDFIVQRSNIIGNVIKIISVFWFFRSGINDIVGYFLFMQFVSLLSVLLTFFFIKKRFNYDLSYLFQSLRFNLFFFKKTKKLAFVSLFMTASWILYYELDAIVIGKFLGLRYVAVYAIGLTVLSFFRSILGILFSPFSNRFNHFIGLDDEKSLKSFYSQIMEVFAPIVIFPIIAITILADPIVRTWVGASYIDSILIVKLLVCCNLFAFITYPTNFILIAKENQKLLYGLSVFLPLAYWFGIYLFIDNWGIYSFAIFKLAVFLLSSIVLFKLMSSFLNIEIKAAFNRFLYPSIIPTIFLILVCCIVSDYLPTTKSKTNLIFVAFIICLLVLLAFLLQYLISKKWRNQINDALKQFGLK